MLTKNIGAEDWRKQLWEASKRRGLFVLGLEAETLKRPHPQGPGAQTLPNTGTGVGESGTIPPKAGI